MDQPKKDLSRVLRETNILSNFENATIDLLLDKSFYARLAMSMQKHFNFKVPTAGVTVKSTGIHLYVNPEFFHALTPKERVALIIHEMHHIINKHLSRFKMDNTDPDGKRKHQIFNIAADLAINQYIKDLPEKGITLDLVKEKFNLPALKAFESSEYYYDQIKQAADQMSDNGEGELGNPSDNMDDHDVWDESDLTEDQKKEAIASHIKAVAQAAKHDKNPGVDLTDIINSFTSQINWKNQLAQFLSNSQEIFHEKSRMKVNRRYGLRQPGNRNETKLNLVCCVDTSGSMSDESLNIIFGEVSRMIDDNVIIHVIEADSKVQRVYVYNKGMKIQVQGRGGTNYLPAFEEAKKLEADAVIYCGDMDVSGENLNFKPTFAVLWAIVGNQDPPAKFGKVIRLP